MGLNKIQNVPFSAKIDSKQESQALLQLILLHKMPGLLFGISCGKLVKIILRVEFITVYFGTKTFSGNVKFRQYSTVKAPLRPYLDLKIILHWGKTNALSKQSFLHFSCIFC